MIIRTIIAQRYLIFGDAVMIYNENDCSLHIDNDYRCIRVYKTNDVMLELLCSQLVTFHGG